MYGEPRSERERASCLGVFAGFGACLLVVMFFGVVAPPTYFPSDLFVIGVGIVVGVLVGRGRLVTRYHCGQCGAQGPGSYRICSTCGRVK